MGWLELENHDKFVSGWQVIADIAALESISLQRAAKLVNLLNERDPIDGNFYVQFYKHDEFNGYRTVSEHECDGFIGGLYMLAVRNTVTIIDDNSKRTQVSPEVAILTKEGRGMDFFFLKEDLVRAIDQKNIDMNWSIEYPSCVKDFETSRNDTSQQTKMEVESPKTVNAQAQFIKSLLYLNYKDEDLLDNPRKYFDDKDSDIRRDFEALGLSIPSGKTISKWLKNVELGKK